VTGVTAGCQGESWQVLFPPCSVTSFSLGDVQSQPVPSKWLLDSRRDVQRTGVPVTQPGVAAPGTDQWSPDCPSPGLGSCHHSHLLTDRTPCHRSSQMGTRPMVERSRWGTGASRVPKPGIHMWVWFGPHRFLFLKKHQPPAGQAVAQVASLVWGPPRPHFLL
jgi:hypothetical protein